MADVRWRILVVNPNTNERTTALLVETARRAAGEEADVQGVTAASGPLMITDPVALSAAASHVVDAALRVASHSRVDAIVVGAYGDPGVEETRVATGLPVIGIGSASMRAAARGGRRFAVATTTPMLAPALGELAKASGVGALYTGCYLTRSAADELLDHSPLVAELREACECARAGGADVVVIGGGPLSAAAEDLVTVFGEALPIVEPVREAVRAVLSTLSSAAAPA